MGPPRAPDCSVIVPAHDAGATIGDTLAALDAQRFAGGYEVIVVDDGSSDDTAAIAARAGARVVRHERARGAAAARNSGAAAATAPILAFTDADCLPTPVWLTEAMGSMESADLVLGPVMPAPDVPMGPFDKSLYVDESSLMFETANLLVKRNLFERLDGFWPFMATDDHPAGSLRGDLPKLGEAPFGEDAWFGWRARRTGAKIAFATEALVHHAVFPRGPGGYLRERWRRRHFPALLRVVPEMRARTYMRWFATRRSAAFDIALGALLVAGAGRRRPALLGVVPYLIVISQGDLRSKRRAAADVAGDAIGLAALVRGSLAARRLLL